MRYNLLKMVQLILSAMDSDEVDSIEDTVESKQVVDVIEVTYNDIVSTIDFPDKWDFFQLQPSLDVTKPTLLSVPDNVGRIEYIQYETEDSGSDNLDYRTIRCSDRFEFLRRMDKLFNTADSPTRLYSYDYLNDDGESFKIQGYNDVQPNYYMTPNNRTIIFDNFDASQGSTIVGARTRCYGMMIPSFVRNDTFVPDLDPRQFTLLLNEAKAQAFIELKQIENTKAEKRAKKGWDFSQRHKDVIDGARIKPWIYDFGRPRVK